MGGLMGDRSSSSSSREDPALKTAGCVCTSPNLNFDTTDASLKKKTPEIFGRYQFAGTEGGRPYYQKSPASTPPTYLFWLPSDKQPGSLSWRPPCFWKLATEEQFPWKVEDGGDPVDDMRHHTLISFDKYA